MTIPADQLTLEQINSMAKSDFVEQLGGIFEHSPWVAEGCTAGVRSIRCRSCMLP